MSAQATTSYACTALLSTSPPPRPASYCVPLLSWPRRMPRQAFRCLSSIFPPTEAQRVVFSERPIKEQGKKEWGETERKKREKKSKSTGEKGISIFPRIRDEPFALSLLFLSFRPTDVFIPIVGTSRRVASGRCSRLNGS